MNDFVEKVFNGTVAGYRGRQHYVTSIMNYVILSDETLELFFLTRKQK